MIETPDLWARRNKEGKIQIAEEIKDGFIEGSPEVTRDIAEIRGPRSAQKQQGMW
jgi:hypothetical protein